MPGTIRKRGTSWQALLSYRDPKTGRQTQASATRPTKRDAEIALAELLLRRDHGRQPGDGRQKFNELVDTCSSSSNAPRSRRRSCATTRR
jgi:hypothetical protein